MKRLIACSTLLLFIRTPLCAAQSEKPADGAADPAACVGEIKRVCAGLEDQLENCATQRAKDLSDSCRDSLQSAIGLSADGMGVGACVPEIKQLCDGLSARELAQCIETHKSVFSKACRDALARIDSASKTAP